MTPDDGSFAPPGTGAGPHALISRYEQIARASHEMLEAARRGDWDRVAGLERQCRSMIAELKRAAESGALSGPEQRRRLALLRTMLGDDAQIRERSEPWLLELESLLGRRRGAR